MVCPDGVDVEQRGPVIYKSSGELVWADPSVGPCNDINLRTYNGEDYLTFWVGNGTPAANEGHGSGKVVLMNSNYEIVMNVTAVSPTGADVHEFNVVGPGNTSAVLTSYVPVPVRWTFPSPCTKPLKIITKADLSSVGGLENGWYMDVLIQEVEISTGALLFNWSTLDHIPLNESYLVPTTQFEGSKEADPWDAVHVNSIDKDDDGNYLISGRHTQTLYKINPQGEIVWRLGGKRSDFTALDNESDFHWQHHAKWRTAGSQISLFDDAAALMAINDTLTVIVSEPVASSKYLNIDQTAMTVSLDKKFLPSPIRNYSAAEGSVEPYGSNVLIGYGFNPWVQAADFKSTEVVFSAVIGPNNASLWRGGINNYRVFQTSTLQFTGHPTRPPNVSVVGDDVYVSWNGATHVVSYDLLTGADATRVSTKVTNVPKSGFETKICAAGSEAFVSVAALAANGTMLGTSAVYKKSDGSVAGQ
ncbi:ASST-domain-containing protein [Mycena sp. CBHHK59/15]|nr:ASST-domain-containing protein [Mycena sp. CBHHK59/15]